MVNRHVHPDIPEALPVSPLKLRKRDVAIQCTIAPNKPTANESNDQNPPGKASVRTKAMPTQTKWPTNLPQRQPPTVNASNKNLSRHPSHQRQSVTNDCSIRYHPHPAKQQCWNTYRNHRAQSAMQRSERLKNLVSMVNAMRRNVVRCARSPWKPKTILNTMFFRAFWRAVGWRPTKCCPTWSPSRSNWTVLLLVWSKRKRRSQPRLQIGPVMPMWRARTWTRKWCGQLGVSIAANRLLWTRHPRRKPEVKTRTQITFHCFDWNASGSACTPTDRLLLIAEYFFHRKPLPLISCGVWCHFNCYQLKTKFSIVRVDDHATMSFA